MSKTHPLTGQSGLSHEQPAGDVPLRLESASCCLCRNAEELPIGIGEDFEYGVTRDVFLSVKCGECGTVFLKQRPVAAELDRIYPTNYHAFSFSSDRFGFAYTVRQRLEARRLMAHCRDLPPDARILDVGCGDGFHLKLLRRFGTPTWELEGVDASDRATSAGAKEGLRIHLGTVEELPASCSGYDLVLLLATIEHVKAPLEMLSAIAARLRPGGRLLLATDNSDSWSYRLFHRRYWGGYHFPRHWYLFRKKSLRLLAERAGLEVESLGTMMSPVNWVYSIHNALRDWGTPAWLVNRFTLSSPVSLAAFTILGSLQQALGQGELLHAVLRRPTLPGLAPSPTLSR